MTVTLNVNPQLEQELQAQAHARGVPLNTVIEEMISKQPPVAVSPTKAQDAILKLPALRLGDVGLFGGARCTTMSVEAGIVDANILIYAINSDAPQHAASRALLEAALEGPVKLYVTSQIFAS